MSRGACPLRPAGLQLSDEMLRCGSECGEVAIDERGEVILRSGGRIDDDHVAVVVQCILGNCRGGLDGERGAEDEDEV